MNLISEDYLMHYGVKGMKWGIRHDPKRTDRAFEKLQNFDEFYTAHGPLTKKQEKQRNKLIKKANNLYDLDKKNISKNEKYKEKLIKRAEKKAGNYRRDARDTKNEIDDIKKMGVKSAYWKQHAREEADKEYQKQKSDLKAKAGLDDSSADFWGKMYSAGTYLNLTSGYTGRSYMNEYVSDLTKSRSNSIRLAKQYTANKKSLMNYKIDSYTRKKDIRKTYRENLHFYE